MPTLSERFRDFVAGSRLDELQSKLDTLAEVNSRIAAAYLSGPYELPPAELVRQLKESYDPQLLQDLVDQLNWEAVSGYGGYSEDERRRAVADSTRMFKYSVLARWIISLWTFYGLGESVAIIPSDNTYKPRTVLDGSGGKENEPDPLSAEAVWKEFWAADRNQSVVAKDRLDEISRWLLVKGERFFVFFASRLDGTTTIRSLSPEQVSAVYANPDDSSEIWFYERRFKQNPADSTEKVLYYPDWQVLFSGKTKAHFATLRTIYPIAGEMAVKEGISGTDACVLFVPFLQLDEEIPRGWPLLAPHGTPWLRAQREYMQDRAAVTKAVAAYVRRYKVSGGSRAVDSITATLMSAYQRGGSYETNPPPVAGSSEVINRAIDAQDLPLRTGASDAKADSEMFAWFAMLAGGIFPHYGGLGDSYRLATACYSEDTEYLGEHGWRSWKDWNGERIATYDHANRQFDYRRPTWLHVYDYDGEMTSIKGRGLDALITPNHRMLILNENNVSKKWAKTEYEVMRADGLPSRFALPAGARVNHRLEQETFTLPVVGEGMERSRKGERIIPMNDWLQFLGWWLSEGWLEGNKVNYVVGISQSINSPCCEQIDSLLARLPLGFFRETCGNGALYRWRINDKALYSWLEENCGSGAANKRLPSLAFLLSASQSCILLDALWDGDGCWVKGQPHFKGFFTTTSRQLADDVQALLLNTGEWGSISVNREAGTHPLFPNAPTCWVVYRNTYEKRSLGRKRNVQQLSYQGKVWCFEAPPHKMFVTRRNGCPLIAGNTSMEKPIEMQFSFYRQQLGAMFRKFVRIVLQFKEMHGGVHYDTYEADLTTDKLVEVDLPVISKSVSDLYTGVIGPLMDNAAIPDDARNKITVFVLQTVLQALGADDVTELIDEDMFGGGEALPPTPQGGPEAGMPKAGAGMQEAPASTTELGELALWGDAPVDITDADVEDWLTWLEKLDPSLLELVLADEGAMREGEKAGG